MLKIICNMKEHQLDSFPYERALALWRSNHERRGENNITNFSSEIDVEHNVLDDHNEGSFGEGHVQNVNWKMNFN